MRFGWSCPALEQDAFHPYAARKKATNAADNRLVGDQTNSGGTDHVWFYDCQADGWSLDDKRTPLLAEDKLGLGAKLGADEHAKNNLPDILKRWGARDAKERKRAKTEQSFCVTKEEIVASEFDLSVSRYKDAVHVEVAHRSPSEIIANLKSLEKDIARETRELEAMLA